MQVTVFALDCLATLARCGRMMRPAVLASLIWLVGAAITSGDDAGKKGADAAPDNESMQSQTQSTPHVRLIGATTVVTEVSTGIPLPARVDTGATSCSIHCAALEIKNEHPNPRENIGKPVRFLLKKSDGEDLWVESKIVDHVKVRTSEREDERYKVRLILRWEDVEKKVVATLNDRQHMKYPMLLGRNFLRDDFLVNVSLDTNE